MAALRVSASSRASASTVGIVVVLAVTIAVAGVATAGLASIDPHAPPPQAAFSLSVDGQTDRLTLRHLGGDTLDVRNLSVRIRVDGTPLSHQPPVPFFAARGYRGGPTGPFNSRADPRWQPGEAASVRVAGTNAPGIDPGVTVTVTLVVDGTRVARMSTTAT